MYIYIIEVSDLSQALEDPLVSWFLQSGSWVEGPVAASVIPAASIPMSKPYSMPKSRLSLSSEPTVNAIPNTNCTDC